MLGIVTKWLGGGEYHGSFQSYVGSHDVDLFGRGPGEEAVRQLYICSNCTSVTRTLLR